MKMLKFLLLICCLLINERLFSQQSQTITLSLKNAPLATVLSEIKKQTGISFFYKKELLAVAGKVSVEADKADLQTVMAKCLRNTPITYSFLADNLIVLTNKNEKKNAGGTSQTDNDLISGFTVRGTVFNTSGERLNGATVTIKRSQHGVIANSRGEFTIENVRMDDTLRVSFIGYTPQDVPVLSATQFNIVLKETQNALDEVMVRAYGTTTKRLAVGEITQVNAKDIERQPVTNPLLALEGQVPGVVISPTSGYTGAPVKVEIRGRNIIDPTVPSDPLYIIDNVPLIIPNIGYLTGQSYQNGSAGFIQAGQSASGGQSPLFSLNPKDIESITVLKDAAAMAMYGSRAGNGVIIITTKKGKPGETRVDANVNQSVTKAIGQWDMLNTEQYLQMRREAFRNAGITPTVANAPDMTLWDTTRYTNWQKELWHTGKTTEANLSLSGGNELTTFRIGANYNAIRDITTISSGSKTQKATSSLNLNHHSLNQKLSIGVSATYGYTNTHQVFGAGSPTLAPDLPPILDKNGNPNYADWNAAGIGGAYPFATLFQPNLTSAYFLSSSLNTGYKIIKGLNLSLNLGYNNAQASNSLTIPIAALNPLGNQTGTVVFGNNSNIGWNINPELNYENYIGKGKLQASIGGTLNSTTANGLTTIGFGYTDDGLLKSINSAPSTSLYQAYAQNKYIDLHGRLNYSWKDKYVLEITGNRDGSSSFGPGRQFGNFWSAGANWILSEEKWLRTALPSWFSLVKVSGTYGTTGISGGDYQYLSQWANSLDGYSALHSYNGSPPLVPIHAVNQEYRWQTDRQSNISFDLGFMNDRFNLHTAIYKKNIDNQLTQLPTALFTGFTGVQGNSRAVMQNTGWEISLAARLYETKDFSWSANFNISGNQNKLVAFPDIEHSPYYTTYKIGQSVNTVYLLHYLGIDPQTGQRGYADYNHDGAINTSGYGAPGTGLSDAYVAINPTPKFTGGVSSNLRYRNFTISLLFNFENKISPIAYTSTAGGMINAPVTVLDGRWQKPGDVAAYPRFTVAPANTDSFFGFSDGAYTDGSFLRLQNINVGYMMPDSFAKKIGAKGLTLSFSMQNVLTFSKYNGIDPEIPFGGQPQPKIFNGSIGFNF